MCTFAGDVAESSEQGPETLVSDTVSPDVAVAVMLKSASPNVLSVVEKSIV
jgi:hypothetical protein